MCQSDRRLTYRTGQLQRPLGKLGAQAARQFVGLVQINVEQWNADTQRTDPLELIVVGCRNLLCRLRQRFRFKVEQTVGEVWLRHSGRDGLRWCNLIGEIDQVDLNHFNRFINQWHTTAGFTTHRVQRQRLSGHVLKSFEHQWKVGIGPSWFVEHTRNLVACSCSLDSFMCIW